jgi:hypothetical protein
LIYQHDRSLLFISDFRPAFDDSVVLLVSGSSGDFLYHFDKR